MSIVHLPTRCLSVHYVLHCERISKSRLCREKGNIHVKTKSAIDQYVSQDEIQTLGIFQTFASEGKGPVFWLPAHYQNMQTAA